MRVILQTWCQIQRTFSSLRYVNCGPVHIQSICSTAYSFFNIQQTESALLFEISRQFNARSTANLEPNTAHIFQFALCELWSRQYTNYSYAYLGFNIQLKLSALLLEISRLFNARYAANLMTNIAHIFKFTLCELWSRPYAM
jgi:hypothetical protein